MSDEDDQSLSDEMGKSAPPKHQEPVDNYRDEPPFDDDEMPPVVAWTPGPPSSNEEPSFVAAPRPHSDIPIPDPRPASEVWPPVPKPTPMSVASIGEPLVDDPLLDDGIPVGLLDDLLDDLTGDVELTIDTADIPLPLPGSWFDSDGSPEVWVPPGDMADVETEPDLLETIDPAVTAEVSGINEPADLGLPRPVDFINPVDLPPPPVNLPPVGDLSPSPDDGLPPVVDLSPDVLSPSPDDSGDSSPPPANVQKAPSDSPSSYVDKRGFNRHRSPPPAKNPPRADTAPVSEPPRPDSSSTPANDSSSEPSDPTHSSDGADSAPWSPLQPPVGESPSQPHAQQWDEAPLWGAPDAPPPEPTSGYSWYVPARRETVYDGPFYTKTGEIHEHALVTKTAEAEEGESGDAPAAPTERFEIGETTDTDTGRTGLPWARLLLSAAVLILAGLAVFAVRQALTTPPGAASPAEAADALFTAIDNEDMVGLAELLAPAERTAYLQPTIEALTELDRLEDSGNIFTALADPDVADGLPLGAKVDIDGLTYKLEEVGPEVYHVVTTGGFISGQGDPDLLPDWFNKLLGEPVTADDVSYQSNLADNPIRLALIEDNGSWYLSVLYSFAEMLRRDANDPVPEFDGDRRAVGTNEPNLAVEELFRSVTKGDVIGALNRLDPVEFKVLYDYREFLDPAVQQAADDFDFGFVNSGTKWQLNRIVTSRNSIRGMTTIGIELLEVTAVIEGEGTLDITMQNGCAVGAMNFETGDVEPINSCALSSARAAQLPVDIPTWLWNDRAQFNIRVVERNGRWYVAGGPTAIGAIADQLAAFSKRDWQERNDSIVDLFDSLPLDELRSGLF